MLLDLMQGHRIDPLEPRRLLAFSVGGTGFDYGSASARLDDGSLIVAGLFTGTVEFEPAGATLSRLTSAGASDIFVAKYLPGDQLQWVRQIGGIEGRFEIEDDIDDAVDVAINPVRIGGEFFVNGVSPQPLDAGEYVNALAVAPDGSIYLTGGFRGRCDFDPGPGTRRLDSDDREFYDIFVTRLTPDGDLVWAERFGGRFTDVGNDIALDAAGNPYVTGLFTRDADFHPGSSRLILTAEGRSDAFAMKLSVNGKLIWVSAVGSDEIARELVESGNGIAVDAIGNVYVTGTFAGLADFNPTPGPLSRFFVEALDETDGFVMQLSTRGKLAWVRTFGGFEFDGGVSIALGNEPTPSVVVAGYFEDIMDVTIDGVTTRLSAAPRERGDDPTDSDLIVWRYANDGTPLWAKQLGGGGYETIAGVATDASNNVYLSGGYWGVADFDPGRSRANLISTRSPFEINDRNEEDDGERELSYDGYFASLDPAGRFRFAKSFGGDADDFVIGMSRAPAGTFTTGFVLTGRIDGTANLDPDGSLLRVARGRADVFVSVFDLSGDLLD
jgi:hypothetical protein